MKYMDYKFGPLTDSERRRMENIMLGELEVQLWCTSVFSTILETTLLIVMQ